MSQLDLCVTWSANFLFGKSQAYETKYLGAPVQEDVKVQSASHSHALSLSFPHPPMPADSGGWGWDRGLCRGPFPPAALWTPGADRRVRERHRGWPPGHHLSEQAALRERGRLLPLPQPAHAGLRQAAG